MTEYTKFSLEEAIYGKRSFLQIQLELLTIVKRIKEYRSLRNDEFALKIALKSKVDETIIAVQNLEKILPKMKIPDMPKKEQHEEMVYSNPLFQKELTIDQELEKIKAKLALLK
jgi:hypothetical protein